MPNQHQGRKERLRIALDKLVDEGIISQYSITNPDGQRVRFHLSGADRPTTSKGWLSTAQVELFIAGVEAAKAAGERKFREVAEAAERDEEGAVVAP
jgi:hypothetical protein